MRCGDVSDAERTTLHRRIHPLRERVALSAVFLAEPAEHNLLGCALLILLGIALVRHTSHAVPSARL